MEQFTTGIRSINFNYLYGTVWAKFESYKDKRVMLIAPKDHQSSDPVKVVVTEPRSEYTYNGVKYLVTITQSEHATSPKTVEADKPFTALLQMRSQLPTMETRLQMKHQNPLPHLIENDVLPVPCVKYDSGRWEKLPQKYPLTDRGSSVILASVNHNFYFDAPAPIIDNKKGGLICFCNANIPVDTIGFQITKRFDKCALVLPITGKDDLLFNAMEQTLQNKLQIAV